jgi:folylpolyglutamate synthase/dihydropteroate synthase
MVRGDRARNANAARMALARARSRSAPPAPAPPSDLGDAAELAELVSTVAGAERVRIEPNLSDAVRAARSTWQIGDAVVITGSITLVGDAITLAQEEGWT